MYVGTYAPNICAHVENYLLSNLRKTFFSSLSWIMHIIYKHSLHLSTSVFVASEIKKSCFHNIRKWSDKFSLWTLFVDIGWKMSEIFDFECLLWSGCDKNAPSIFFWEHMKTLHRSLISASRPLIWAMNHICTIYFL